MRRIVIAAFVSSASCIVPGPPVHEVRDDRVLRQIPTRSSASAAAIRRRWGPAARS